ncbi:MAG: hypothetical protein NUV76_10260 [Candidatus Kuenenia sp.]|nr:hypothetical protein [Candidatus Kuenenia sp.]
MGYLVCDKERKKHAIPIEMFIDMSGYYKYPIEKMQQKQAGYNIQPVFVGHA